MIRRLICLLSILALCCVFTACKKDNGDGAGNGTNANGGGDVETPDDGDGSPTLEGGSGGMKLDD